MLRAYERTDPAALATLSLRWLLLLCLGIFALATAGRSDATPKFDSLKILVPSSPDGGWARTATAVRRTLLAEGLVRDCEIVYSPGAGGLIGLAGFVSSEKGNPASIMLGGRSIVSAAIHNRSRLSLADVSPVARLIGTEIAIAVSAQSPIRDIADLIEKVRKDDRAIHWVGGSEGGVDHLTVIQLTEALGGNRSNIEFEAVPGGGVEEMKRLATRPIAAALGSYEEFARLAQQGKIRILAVSSKQRNPGVDAPTLREAGLDIATGDWRAVFAPPGLTQEQRRRLIKLFEQMIETDHWRKELQVYQWQDRYLPGAQFGAAIDGESRVISVLLNGRDHPVTLKDEGAGQRDFQTYLAVASGGVLAGMMLLSFMTRRATQGRDTTRLPAGKSKRLPVAPAQTTSATGTSNRIDSQFNAWQLTIAEKEIAWMLLKGLPFRFMAEARGTTERTVREQARSIYAKSELENRASLAAFFLEDFVFDGTA